ncbi:MAG: diguanylate cyclase [Butyrivibrio sp.]|nr:diguanylate cyclase [Butyrivibrio sp.]
MISSPYLLAVILAVVELIALLAGIRRRNTTSVFFYVTILIANLGYYAVSVSYCVEEAILATKIAYLGGIFLPFMLLLTICDFCKFRLPGILLWGLFGFSLVTLGSVFSIGYSDLYCKEVALTRYGGFGLRSATALEEVPGPLHGLYTFLLVSMILVAFCVVTHVLTNKTRVSKHLSIVMFSELFFCLVVYLLHRATGNRMTFLPYAYVIVGFVHLSTALELQFYDTSAGFQGYRVEHKSRNAYISYNRALRVMDATENVVDIYPELLDVRFGTYVYDTETDYYRDIHQWLGKLTEQTDLPREKTVSHGDQFYRVSMIELSALNGNMQGYMVEIHDDTKNHARVQELEQDKTKLANDATTDAMTGLMNKVASEEAVDELAASGAHATFLMLDLDCFKLVNDLYGHDAGDKVLIQFAKLMRGITRVTDIVGRIGGDEFIICFRGWQTVDSLERWTASLNADLVAYAQELLGAEMGISLGVSVGAAFIPDSGTNYSDIKKKTDKALYYVKQHGKHGLHVHKEQGTVTQETSRMGNWSTDELLQSLGERNILPGSMALNEEGLTSVFRFLKRYYDASAGPCSIIVLRPEGDHILDDGQVERFMDLLQKSLRQKDLVSRSGLNTFIAILPDTDEAGAKTAAAGIIAKWAAMSPEQTPLKYEVRGL